MEPNPRHTRLKFATTVTFGTYLLVAYIAMRRMFDYLNSRNSLGCLFYGRNPPISDAASLGELLIELVLTLLIDTFSVLTVSDCCSTHVICLSALTFVATWSAICYTVCSWFFHAHGFLAELPGLGQQMRFALINVVPEAA